jgi:hypothetical protein
MASTILEDCVDADAACGRMKLMAMVVSGQREMDGAAILSSAGFHTGAPDILTNFMSAIDGEKDQGLNTWIVGFISTIDSASVSSALGSFGIAWRNASDLRVEGTLDELAVATASNDIGAVGRLLGRRSVDAVHFNEKELSESLIRRPLECSLLDVAVGSGSVEMTKYLFEFHRAKATRETLKQSISTGNLGMIRMVRERLPEGELRDRLDLLEVAAGFHQEEVLVWLLRDATVLEREVLGVFALEWKLADALLVALEKGFRPWSWRALEVLLECRASSEMEFVSAPEGFSSQGGWWTTCQVRRRRCELLEAKPGLARRCRAVGLAVALRPSFSGRGRCRRRSWATRSS